MAKPFNAISTGNVRHGRAKTQSMRKSFGMGKSIYEPDDEISAFL